MGFSSAAWADPPSITETHEMTEVEDASQSSNQNAELLQVEPRGLDVSADEDTDDLNAVASQINQVIDSDSDGFLPEGMVVRGSAGSLQLGSEI